MLTKDAPPAMRTAAEQNRLGYVLGGRIHVFEIVNEVGFWTVTSRRAVTLEIHPSRWRPSWRSKTSLGLVALALSLLAIAGCGRHYWSRSGASLDDFNRDSAACAKAASPAYGIVVQENYRRCLRDKGWQRAHQLDPPPPGWYRGIE